MRDAANVDYSAIGVLVEAGCKVAVSKTDAGLFHLEVKRWADNGAAVTFRLEDCQRLQREGVLSILESLDPRSTHVMARSLELLGGSAWSPHPLYEEEYDDDEEDEEDDDDDA